MSHHATWLISTLVERAATLPWQDVVNGAYELFAGVAVLGHCRRLWIDKVVQGASPVATGFFFTWGIWNLYYYPHLDQWVSFVGGLSIVASNCLWLALMVKYWGNRK